MKSLLLPLFCIPTFLSMVNAEPDQLFGEKFQNIDHLSTGEWWKRARLPKCPPKKDHPSELLN